MASAMTDPRETTSDRPNTIQARLFGFLRLRQRGDVRSWGAEIATVAGHPQIVKIANGKVVISNQEIPGITGGAIDSNEGAPGPLLLQGDHGPIEYRNIVLTPAR